MSQNEKLIQNGFELIVRAFDDMERDCKEKVRMLEKKVNELEKENNELRQDNKMLLNENRKMEQIINNLNYNLDSTKKKLDIVRLSVVDNNNNNNNNNIHRKGSKDNSNTRNNISLKRNVTSGGRLNTVSSINTNNNNNNNLNNSEYYLNTATTLPLDTEIEDDESVDVNYIQPQLNPTKSLLNPNYHAKSINNNNNNNTNYIQQLKTSHFRTHSLNYPSTTRERCLTTIGKETLTTNPNEINNFLMKCKEIITANIFEKILLLFNNHKTGLISTHDLIKRIREFISSNKYLTNIFNQLIIIN